ncbi:MAG: 16S rRNA (cytosine(967)-C(5))-methyltransferase RsmB [Syntrophobacterales bacterium]|nr:MAG: 16S rRNA (cytosine(967)-C(5))-methyltransferase RsmB [Syntrophobacterales bacterium]
MKKSKRKNPRRIALDILMEIEGKYLPLDLLMERKFKRHEELKQVDYAFITEAVYGTLRWRGRIDWIIGRISRVKPERLERFIRNLLRLGLYQILFMDKVPVSAAVNESVETVKASGKERGAAFINAVLRRISDGRADMEVPHAKDPSSISVRHSHPLWLVERWAQELGLDETIELCMANNRIPPLSLRTNTLKTSRAKLLAEIKGKLPQAVTSSFSPEGILIDPPVPLSRIPRFREGWFQVQDESSQLIGHIVDPQPGERVLDACAAPGGKTTHLAQLMGNRGRIYAADISVRRLSLLKENCHRLGVSMVTPLRNDLVKPMVLESDERFDRILIDPPCSGLGTLWRNPDIKWKRREEEISTFRGIQRAILHQLAPWLRKGGSLVYGTCTLSREENEEMVADFIAEHQGFELEDIRRILPQGLKPLIGEDGFFRSFTHRHSMDGFFAARLKRVSD